MKIIVGYKIGIFKPLLDIPDLMRSILEYFDCSSLISLSMANKQFFGLHENIQNSSDDHHQKVTSSTLSVRCSSEAMENSLLMDVNLWKYLLHFYENSNKGLATFKYEYQIGQPLMYEETLFRKCLKNTFKKVYQSREGVELEFYKDDELVKTHERIMEIIEKLKECYPLYKKLSTRKHYMFDIDRNGRGGCRYKNCRSFERLCQNGPRGKTMSFGCSSWDGIYHVRCFIELLHEKHVNIEGIDYDIAIKGEAVEEMIRESKNARYRVYTCDKCKKFIQQTKIYTTDHPKTGNAVHICQECCHNHNSRLIPTMENPISYKCSLCIYPIVDTLFSCRNCEDTYICSQCIRKFRWGKHKLHDFQIIGKSKEEYLEYINYFNEREESPEELIEDEVIERVGIDFEKFQAEEKPKKPKKKKQKTQKITKKNESEPSVVNNATETQHKVVTSASSDACLNQDEIQEISKKEFEETPQIYTDPPNNQTTANNVSSDSATNENETGVYQVEALLQSKTIRRKKYYLIKWEGYPESANSWEPSENISSDLIKSFNKKQKVTRNPKRKR